jgi:hypothetical protein
MGRFRCYKPRLTSQQFLHHCLLEGEGFLASLLQRSYFGVHVGQHLGDARLFA